ncbi:LysR family transcriptional regulator [Streptomyces sp. ZYX-F-203]
MLDLRRLEILCRFAVRGTITATAADLGYSPSAVSQQLTTLEKEAGVPLLERTAQRATLTDAGRELVRHATGILAAAETARARMRARAGTVAGKVVVSCIPALAPALAPHLAALQRDHPALTVVALETGSASAAAAVLDRRHDLAVIDEWSAAPSPVAGGLRVDRLRGERIVLAVPTDHPEAGLAAPVTHARLAETVRDHTWLCAPAGELSRAAGDRRLVAAGAAPPRRWEFQGLRVLAALVAAGSGVALLPEGVAREEPGVRGVRLAPPMRRGILALTRPGSREDPAVAACLEATRRALGERRHADEA